MCWYAYCFKQTVLKGGLLIWVIFRVKYKRDPLVSISLNVLRAILVRTTTATHRSSMSTVELQYPPLLFIMKENFLDSCVFDFFFFFRTGVDATELTVLYIFYNALWLLKIKIHGKQVVVHFITANPWALARYADMIYMFSCVVRLPKYTMRVLSHWNIVHFIHFMYLTCLVTSYFAN